ncbi:MAG: spermidine synthase [Candidatus Omnitrophica bacterium]|nr:spermidine synthase [Candidatus Omnitrophota bacterium]
MTIILCLIFFLSGVSALIFELVWFQLAGLVFGNSVHAAAIVLASFMGGLALGNGLIAFKGFKIKSPLLFYAFLQFAIALFGFLLVLIFPELTRTFVPVAHFFTGQTLVLNIIRAIFCILLMIIPTSAMGATLPLLVKALYAKKKNYGNVFGLLYGWNTFGAVIGVLFSEMFIIRWVGLIHAGAFAAGCNILAAIITLSIFKNNSMLNADLTKTDNSLVCFKFSSKSSKLLLASFLSGFVFLGLEVIWFRFIRLFLMSRSLNFAIMLAVVLLGICFGGLFAAMWFKRDLKAQRFLFPIMLTNGLLVIGLYGNFGFFHQLIMSGNNFKIILLISSYLMFPISFASGITFTMLCKALHSTIEDEIKATGVMSMVNTIGGALGSLVAGIILIPLIGIERSFFLFALSYGLIAALLFDKKLLFFENKKKYINQLVGGLFIVSLILFPFGLMNRQLLDLPILRLKQSGEQRVAFKEGLNESIQYLEKKLLGNTLYHRLMTNDHMMSGTSFNSKRYMSMFVYLPMAIHPDPKDALLICYGCGITAKALTDTRHLENIEIVDISRDIIDMSHIIFPDPKENPIYDPRVKIHIDDGRFFMLTTKQKFDIITAEPPPPKNSGVVNLYTQEYFQLAYDCLKDGGIVTHWLPIYQLEVSDAKAILKAFCNVFDQASLWSGSGYQWMMVGIKNPKEPVSEELFSMQWNDPIIGPKIRSLGFESPEQFGGYFIADGKRLENWISESLPLVDNYPQRLSNKLVVGNQDINAYRELRNAANVQKNFSESKIIKKIWPKYFQQQTEKYFKATCLIDEFLQTRESFPKNIKRLDKCLNDPLLRNYIIFVLESDYDAQKICFNRIGDNKEAWSNVLKLLQYQLKKAVQEKNVFTIKAIEEVCIHLGAAAVQRREFLIAEKFYQLLGRNIVNAKKYSYLRMYLLYLCDKKKESFEIKQNFLKLKDVDTKEKDQLEKYWHWLEEYLGT